MDKSSNISVDESFLKNFIGKGGKATDIASGQQISTPVEADEYLKGHVASKNTEKLADASMSEDEARVRSLNRRSDRLAYTDAEREQRKQERERQQQRAARQRGIAAANITMDSINSGTQRLIDRVSAAPVPGGIGLLVAVIVLLLFVVVQVNAEGDTRLKMFWYMLNGRASLVGSKKPTGVTTSSTIGGTNVPLNPDGTCPTGYQKTADGTQCTPFGTTPTITPTPSGGPTPMILYPINNTYRTITGGPGF